MKNLAGLPEPGKFGGVHWKSQGGNAFEALSIKILFMRNCMVQNIPEHTCAGKPLDKRSDTRCRCFGDLEQKRGIEKVTLGSRYLSSVRFLFLPFLCVVSLLSILNCANPIINTLERSSQSMRHLLENRKFAHSR